MNIGNVRLLRNITSPRVLGDNLLILAGSPDTNRFFDNKSIQNYFENYDIAFLNKTPLCFEDKLHAFKPKYLFFMDGIFYEDNFDGENAGNKRKEWVEKVISKIDWECNIVTPCLGKFNVDNHYLQYFGLSPFSSKYIKALDYLFSKNIINTGLNNVVFGALYFGITFGYKHIGLMGFPYRAGYSYMDIDGYHVDGYEHCYDKDAHTKIIPYKDLFYENKSFVYWETKRALNSQKQLCSIARYAKEHNVQIINYTEKSYVDVFEHRHIE